MKTNTDLKKKIMLKSCIVKCNISLADTHIAPRALLFTKSAENKMRVKISHAFTSTSNLIFSF